MASSYGASDRSAHHRIAFQSNWEILRKQALSKKDAVVEERRKRKEGEGEKFCWSARVHGRDMSFARGLRAEIRSFGTAIMLVLCLCLGFADLDFLELML